MAQISLRAYTHEIEEMIEHNQFDQAIAHCRNILKYYPKHINTYRLLGKAFLESQRYGDAGDIFQRILSSFPEDFISHVGMSIIREDEGNLDDSLWHMERAFEMQPSNNAIQGELRRLHGKLEGTEPAKVRLTRGALAHMYIRGDLLSQAIAELRIALTEDPSRFDLQTILAKAYHQSGQFAEAAKICNTIIEKLPYNFEANRILSEVYKKSDRSQEAEAYRQHLSELDPYFAHVNDKTPTPEQVKDTAVTVEKLDWKPGFTSPETSAQPEWAKSIGVSVESPISPKESMPDWFSTTEETPIIPSQTLPPIIDIKEEESQIPSSWQIPEPASENLSTPDWASSEETLSTDDASFIQAVEAAQEEPQVFSEKESVTDKSVPAGAEELEPADIPDWLRALKPQTSSLEGKLPEAMVIPPEPPKEQEYSWLDQSPVENEEKLSPPEEKASTPFDIPGEDNVQIPEWLQESETPIAPKTVEPQPIQELDQFAPQPTEEFLSERTEQEKNEPSWLSVETPKPIDEEHIQKESTIWAEEIEEEVSFSDEDEELPPAEEVELPEWLAKMKQEAEQNPELIKPSETIPDWVQNLEEPPVAEEDTKPTRLAQPPGIQEPTPVINETYPGTNIFDTPEIKDYEETSLPSFFEEKESESMAEAQEISASDFTKAVEEEAQTDWLTEMEAQEQYEQSVFQKETPETPPGWVSENLTEKEDAVIAQEEAESLEEVQLPDWLAEMAPKAEEEIKPAAEEKPDWLSEYKNEPSQHEELEESIPSVSDIDATPELPFEEKTEETVDAFSVEGFAEPEVSKESEQPEEKESLPDWLLEYEEEEPTAMPAESIPEQPQASETPAWFEQPDKIAGLDISFDEELPTEQASVFEQEQPGEDILSTPVELETAPVFEMPDEMPAFEASTEELQYTEKSISETPEEEMPLTETYISEVPTSEIYEEEIVEGIPPVELPVEEAPVEEISAEALPVEEAPVEEIPPEELPVEEAPVEEVSPVEAPLEEISVEELPAEEAPVEEIPPEELPVEEVSPVEAPLEEIPAEELPAEEAPVEVIPAEELPVEQFPVEEVSPVEAPLEEIPAVELPVEQAPVEEIPVETLPIEQAPVEEIPAEELPVEQAQVEEVPPVEALAEEIPAEALPVEEAPVEEIPAEELPIEQAPVEEIPAEELPVEEAPVEEIPAEELPVEEAPVEEIPAEELPVEEAPVEEIPAEELPVEQAPVEEVTPVEALAEEIPAEELPVEQAPVEEVTPVEAAGEEKPKPYIKAPVTRQLSEEIPGEEIKPEAEFSLIDLNKASLVDLERIPGIGFIKAQNIINFRNKQGAFSSLEDLTEVPGFDQELIDTIKNRIAVFVSDEKQPQGLAEEETQTPILKARNDLQQGKISEAVSQYLELIKINQDLNDIAYDLQVAIDQYPTETDLWQTLGDTCVRLGKLQDALNAYTQAEKLVR